MSAARLAMGAAAWLLPAALVALGDTAGERGGGLPAPVVDADYYDGGAPAAAKVELGRLLFFDKLLSGNRNISCATCHHPRHATADGVALGLGEGARGLGPERVAGRTSADAPHGRVPRNAPALWNLGAREFTRLFHDGRVEVDERGGYRSGFVTPARWKLPAGLDNVLAAQAMFPVTSPIEMAGQQGENDVGDARALARVAGPGGVWDLLAERLRAIPEYVEWFRRAFPGHVERAEDITFVHAANAIAAFESSAFRADGSPFDRVLRGGPPLPRSARSGMALFYGRARCATCHAGKFQTDHRFHAIAMPQIGPGKGDGRDASYWQATGIGAFVEDHGRGRVTVRREDRFAFRTPSLRNVELTGPWGHAGSYRTLEAAVRHHLDPVAALEAYELPADLLPPLDSIAELTARGPELRHVLMTPRRAAGVLLGDGWVQATAALRGRIAAANRLAPVALSDREVDDLVAFLRALTDPRARALEGLVPARVPSGLPVED